MSSPFCFFLVSTDELETMAEKLKMGYDDFVIQTRKALTQENVGAMNFDYDVKRIGDDIKFSWKKCMTRDKIKVVTLEMYYMITTYEYACMTLFISGTKTVQFN